MILLMVTTLLVIGDWGPPSSFAGLDLIEAAAMLGAIAIGIRAAPRPVGEGLVAAPLELPATDKLLVACLAEDHSNDRGPVLVGRVLALLNEEELGPVVGLLAVCVAAAPGARSNRLVPRPLQRPAPLVLLVARVAEGAPRERAPVLTSAPPPSLNVVKVCAMLGPIAPGVGAPPLAPRRGCNHARRYHASRRCSRHPLGSLVLLPFVPLSPKPDSNRFGPSPFLPKIRQCALDEKSPSRRGRAGLDPCSLLLNAAFARRRGQGRERRDRSCLNETSDCPDRGHAPTF